MSIEIAILKTYDPANHRAGIQLAGSLTTYLDRIPVSSAIPSSAMVIGNRVIVAIPGGNIKDAVIIATWPQGSGGGGMTIHGNEYHDPAFASVDALNAHAALTAAHGATSEATPARIIVRDPSGRAKVAAPAAADDIARKAEVDAKPSTFLQLTDTPGSYAGQALKLVRVKSDVTGLEFTDPVGGGDLFALTRFLRAARYHTFPKGTNTTLTITANTLYAVPFVTPVARTITRMAIHVTTSATGNARLGIFQDDGLIYPGARVIDAGAVDTGTTGVKELTGLSVALVANTLYWLALVANAAPALAAHTAGTGWSLLGFPASALNTVGHSMWTASFTYGALPATFPGAGTTSTANIPKIAVYF